MVMTGFPEQISPDPPALMRPQAANNNTTHGIRLSKSRSMPHCRVLPPGEFNGKILVLFCKLNNNIYNHLAVILHVFNKSTIGPSLSIKVSASFSIQCFSFHWPNAI